MMGRQDGQMKMIVVDLPEDHLLKRIDQSIDFKFLYELMMPYYSNLGKRSIDPVSMVKMLLVGYLFGAASERRLVQEIQLNIAYRWFCGFGIDDEIPEHSVFSQNRRRKWRDSNLFEQIFLQIVRLCIEGWTEIERSVSKSMHSYLDVLDEELAAQPGFKKPPERTVTV